MLPFMFLLLRTKNEFSIHLSNIFHRCFCSSAMATKFHVLVVLCIHLVHCCCILSPGEAASQANTTDPREIEALKTIAKKLGNKMWSFSLDPCSGKGGWDISRESPSANFVECNCTLDGGKFCHVTRILLKTQSFSSVFPSEFANLTYLEELDLTRNYLSGTIPAELGSLIYLKILTIGSNGLSGNIPKELGNLSRLEQLIVRSNNLSGKLPKQLASLTNLQKLHVGCNQFNGTIPKRYSHFKVLKEFLADSNNIVGKIPDFIGNWKNIEILRLEGTSLKGPIPWTFSGLTSLKDLRLSDITGGRSNLSFVCKLNKLKTLVLRNSLIYGEIPPDIGHFNKLKTLDLRFNNLEGSIPKTFQTFTLSPKHLEDLYLGNNSLSGELQPWLGIINYVDLSYNNFSGEFPRNFSETDSHTKNEMNLIGNSFNIRPTDERVQDILQRNFKCDKELQSSLAIDCGGPGGQYNSIFYEQDENPLSPAAFWSPQKRNWAVSNTGHFSDSKHTEYIKTVKNSLSQLYWTARASSTSLRYYGLCLQKGLYKVQLHFAEIVFSNDKSYENLGRRIFDVYIQGARVLQNFDIMEAAGGAEKAVVKDFNMNITKNYLEIHFYWAGKGTYNVPDEGEYGPLVSAIVITSANIPIKGRNNTPIISTPVIIGIVFGVVTSLSLALCLTVFFIKKRNRIKKRSMEADVNTELTNMKTTYNSFSLEEIKAATCDFHSDNKIGEGGFGAVFKGILPDGRMIAVKQMFSKSRQGNREFLNEVGTISAVHHPNLVKLWGCCIEGKQLLLVYEYMVNNSLARALFGPQECRLSLNWPTRYNICLGVARGLAYLHEESILRIVHRDIKSTNILLDKDLNPKISDFGLAKLFDREKTHVSTRVAGTIGYMAPEYALKGQLTEKADVFGFGVVVLEVVSGRAHTVKKLQEEMVYLLEWAWQLFNENRLLDLVDINLKNSSFSSEEVLRTINVGLLCTHATPTLRPSMSAIVEMLEGKLEARLSHCQYHVFTEERQLPSSGSLSLEGPSTSSSQASFAVKKQQKAHSDE